MGEVTNEVIVERIEIVREEIKELKGLQQITNGRVRKLELSRAIFLGVMIAINALYLPIAIWAIEHLLSKW